MSYAIVWQEEDGTVYAGRLDVSASGVCLDGLSRQGLPHLRSVPFSDVSGIHTARSAERIGGRPTLVVDQESRPPLRIGSISGSSLLSELAEELMLGAFAA